MTFLEASDLAGYVAIGGAVGVACVLFMGLLNFLGSAGQPDDKDDLLVKIGLTITVVIAFTGAVFWLIGGAVASSSAVDALEKATGASIPYAPDSWSGPSTWVIDDDERICYARGVAVRGIDGEDRQGSPRLYCENSSGGFTLLTEAKAAS